LPVFGLTAFIASALFPKQASYIIIVSMIVY